MTERQIIERLMLEILCMDEDGNSDKLLTMVGKLEAMGYPEIPPYYKQTQDQRDYIQALIAQTKDLTE